MGGMNVSDRQLMEAALEWPPPPETAQDFRRRVVVDPSPARPSLLPLEMLGIAGLV